jgi:homoserine kinase
MKNHVIVKVPATSANMGPGFDCLGIALDIWNTIEIEVGVSGFEITGEGVDTLPYGEGNLVYDCVYMIFKELGQTPPKMRIMCDNRIPLDRGLGSSSAALVGGLMAANELCGGLLSQKRVLEIAVDLEGHPDNVSPAMLGGFQIGVLDDGDLVTCPVPVPEGLKAVVFVPDVPMPTIEARGILPDMISRKDAVFNIGRAALLVHAFATGDLKLLPVATDDRLHQPARQKIFFPMRNIFRAALEAGALGVYLSGAGSSILALTKDREFTIGYEMADAANKSGVGGNIKVTQPTLKGAYVVGD